MTELSFLINLLLNDKLPLEIKKEVAERLKEVESSLLAMTNPVRQMAPIIHTPTAQAPSTQKILDEMAMNPAPVIAPQPATMAAAQALNSRQEAIRQATSGKAEPGRNSPRKF